MQWSDISFRPPAKTLRQFAGLWLAVFAGLACWQGLVHERPVPALVLGGLAVAVGLPGLARPGAVRWVFVGAQIVTFPIGWVLSQAVLALLFFGLFTPLDAAFRLLGRDALGRGRREGVATYWTAKPAPAGVRGYFRQY
jgi:hypothetical protein